MENCARSRLCSAKSVRHRSVSAVVISSQSSAGEVKGSAGESEVLDGLKMWRLQGAKIPGQEANDT